jgi:hypothetical protein
MAAWSVREAALSIGEASRRSEREAEEKIKEGRLRRKE